MASCSWYGLRRKIAEMLSVSRATLYRSPRAPSVLDQDRPQCTILVASFDPFSRIARHFLRFVTTDCETPGLRAAMMAASRGATSSLSVRSSPRLPPRAPRGSPPSLVACAPDKRKHRPCDRRSFHVPEACPRIRLTVWQTE